MTINRFAGVLRRGLAPGWIVASLLLSPGLPVLAEAVPVTCYIKNHSSPEGAEIPCRAKRRVNARGHVVYDFVWEEGARSTLVFWKDEKVESMALGLEGEMEVMTGYFRPVDGGVDVVLSHGSILFLKGLNPHRN